LGIPEAIRKHIGISSLQVIRKKSRRIGMKTILNHFVRLLRIKQSV